MAYLLLNLLHGLVSLFWIAGLRRFSGPIPPGLEAQLLGLSICFPVLALLARLTGLLHEDSPGPLLLRIEEWEKVLYDAHGGFILFFSILCVGTALLTLFQEVLPALKNLKKLRFRASKDLPFQTDPRVQNALQKIALAYQEKIQSRPPHRKTGWLHSLVPQKVETPVPLIAVRGILRPKMVFSTGLLVALNDDELEAAVAHECAHFTVGSSLKLILLWFVRLMQIANPATLIAFRELVEKREAACDTWAAWVTGKPEALVSAISKITETLPRPFAEPGHSPSVMHRAHEEILRRANQFSIGVRIEALQKEAPSFPLSRLSQVFAAGLLAILLWGIR